MLTKRWRQCQNLAFLSFALELAVLRAVTLSWGSTPGRQLAEVFQFLADQIQTAQLIDPANQNNNLADELTAAEKRAIAVTAKAALQARTWQEIIW